MFELTNISIILFVTTAINLVAAYISWQRKKTRTGLYLAQGLSAVTVWTLVAGFDYAAISIPLKVFFAKWEYTAYNLAFLFLVLFSLSFAGYGALLKKSPAKVFLGFITISNILLAWTNDWHKWLWNAFTRSEFGENAVVFEHGGGYLWAAVTGYVMIGIIIISFWLATHRGADISRRQARVLLGATLFPILSNLVYLFQPVEYKAVDWTSVTFSVSSLMFVWALYGMRLMDLVPIARDKVIAGMSDGMIVLDMQDRILDINKVAADMLRSSPVKLSGKNILELMPYARLLKEQAVEKEIRTELALGDSDKRHFDVLISPLFEDQTRIVGRLIIFRDITESNQARLELEERLLEIQKLNQDLQESQTQLVEQQRALATLEERQRLARDLHDLVTQSINGIVLFTETLAATLDKNNIERARQIMDRLRESAKQSLKETRLMLYELQDLGSERSVDFIRDLEARLATVESRVGVRTQLIREGSLEFCPPEWNVNLFWIAVEALNNALKYAQAGSVQIVIRCSHERLELEVIDDGIGFDPGKVEAGGLGLKNLRERADIIGGTLSIESEPSKGTTVRFEAEIEME